MARLVSFLYLALLAESSRGRSSGVDYTFGVNDDDEGVKTFFLQVDNERQSEMLQVHVQVQNLQPSTNPSPKSSLRKSSSSETPKGDRKVSFSDVNSVFTFEDEPALNEEDSDKNPEV